MKIKKYNPTGGTNQDGAWEQQYPEVNVGAIVTTNDPDDATGSTSGSFLRGDGTWSNHLTGELKLGDVTGDDYLQIEQIANGLGFTFQYSNASSIQNLQGSTNQALVLGDTDGSGSDTLLGASILSGSTWTKKLNLLGTGELYIGSTGTDQVWHNGIFEPIVDNLDVLPTYQASNEDFIKYNTTERAIEVQSSTDDSFGAVYPAIKTESGVSWKISFSIKASASATSGVYFRPQEYDGALPDGKTHTSALAVLGQIQSATRQRTSFYENQAIGTDWEQHSFFYTPTSTTSWFSLMFLNWTGLGNNSLFIKNLRVFAIQEDSADANTLDNLNSTQFVRSDTSDTMAGDYRIESGSFASLILDRGTTGSGSVVQFENNNGIIGGIGAFGDDGLQFRTADGTQMVLDASNNLGVGTETPTQKLDVSGSIRASSNMYAARYYDLNDSSYYTDPASTSNVNQVNVRRLIQSATGVPTNNLGGPSITEMALFQEQFNNKTAFYDISDLKFYTSSDGTNWTEYTSFSDDNKRKFLGGDYNSGIIIPNGTAHFRIELENNGNYVYLNALYMYWSSQSHNTTVKIQKRQYSTQSWSQHTNSSATVSSWPGHLYLPFSTIAFHPSTHYDAIRIDFEPTWSTGSYSTRDIALYRMQIWGGYPAGKQTIYTVDEYRRVIFPEDVRIGGDSKRLDLARGTTSSQPKIIVGEQGTYGLQLRWDSGSRAHFDRFWSTSIDGTPSSQMMTFDINNDRIGIANASPAQKLDVNGITRIYQSSQSALKTYSAQAGLQLVGYQSDSGSPYTKTSDIVANADGTVASQMRFFTKASGSSSAAERVRIESNGDVKLQNNLIFDDDANNSDYLIDFQEHPDGTYGAYIRYDGSSSNALEIGTRNAGTETESIFIDRNTADVTFRQDVTIQGDLTINGSYTQVNTVENTTEQWSVTNDGTGPAVTINQTGAQPVMRVQDDSTTVFEIVDGGNTHISNAKELTFLMNGQSYGSSLYVDSSNNTLLNARGGSGKTLTLRTYSGSGWNTGLVMDDVGNVGIGVTDPDEKLEVSGNAHLDYSLIGRGFRASNRGELHLNATGTNDVSEIFFGYGDGYTADSTIRWAISDRGTTTGKLVFYRGPANGGFASVMTFTDDNDVGIGTDSPSYGLDVHTDGGQIRAYGTTAKVWAEASDSGQASLELKNTNTHLRFIGSNGGYQIYDQIDGAERFSIDTNGNSKITGNLTVQSTYPRIYLTDTDSNNDFSIINGNGTFSIYDDTAGLMRMQINSSGDTTFSSGAVVATDYMYAHANFLTKGNLYLNYDNNPAGADAYVYFGDDASDTAHWLRFDNSAQQFGISNRLVGTAGRLGAIEYNGSDVDKVNFALSGSTLTITTS